MTIDQNPNISVDDVRRALPHALDIVDQRWLAKQKGLRSSDKLLIHPAPALRSRLENLHAVAMGPINDPMHPVAECIISAEKALSEVDSGLSTAPSAVLLTRLLSLRDISLARNRIEGINERLTRLTGEDWKAVLFEMLTVISYPDNLNPELVRELPGVSTPDIQLNTDPISSVECKARLQYQHKVKEFIRTWRRNHLAQIHKSLVPGDYSYIVRIEVDSLEDYKNSPDGFVAKEIAAMIDKKIQSSNTNGCRINVDYYSAKQVLLKKAIPIGTHEIWEHGWDFDDWEDWHYILPTGDIALADADPRLATRYAQRVIICVRASELANDVPSIRSALKSACRRQLKTAETGIVHLLVDADMFGLGEDRDADRIMQRLEPDIGRIFMDYSRLWRLYINVMRRGDYFDIATPSARRMEAVNPRGKAPRNYQTPCPIILV